MINRKKSRYILGILCIAFSAVLLAALTGLYYILPMPFGLSLFPEKYMAYLTCNALTAIMPFLIYSVWYFMNLFRMKHKTYRSYHENAQGQPVCVLVTAILCTAAELFFVSQIHFSSFSNGLICLILSVLLYTAAAAAACRFGHPF